MAEIIVWIFNLSLVVVVLYAVIKPFMKSKPNSKEDKG